MLPTVLNRLGCAPYRLTTFALHSPPTTMQAFAMARTKPLRSDLCDNPVWMS